MSKEAFHTASGGPKSGSRMTLGRAAAIAVVAIPPTIIGWFHMSVHPLIPFRAERSLKSPGTQDSQTPPGTVPSAKAERLGVARARNTIATTLPLVFGSGALACLILGLLGVPHPPTFAFMQACVSTAAHMVSDGHGAILGPIVWPFLPFLPRIGLGKTIRKRLLL